MIPVDEIAMRPTISFLSSEDKDKIHNAAFQLLSEIGMKILQDEALALLKDAGCSVAEDRMVKNFFFWRKNRPTVSPSFCAARIRGFHRLFLFL